MIPLMNNPNSQHTEALPVRQIGGLRRASLYLDHTVLVFRQRQAGVERTLYIPVELVSISERRRFRGKRLITALLLLASPLVVFGTLSLIMALLHVPKDSKANQVIIFAMPFLLLVGLLFFCLFLTKFFFRARTFFLTITSPSMSFEFWKEKKYADQIDSLIKQIEKSQANLTESTAQPIKSALTFVDQHTIIWKALAFTWLSLMPALLTEIPILLLLVIVPFVWLTYKEVQYIKQPREYKQALKFYLKKDWHGALDALDLLRQRQPDYVPAIVLMANTYIRLNDFDRALQVTSQLPDERLDLSRDLQTRIWDFQRLYERLKNKT